MTISSSDSTPLFCYRHPDRETMLRCARCERPICAECAVLTPTGYRCKECVRGQQKAFETALWRDYPVALLLSMGLSLGGSFIAGALGFFTIFIAPIIGVLISEAVRWAVGKRRSRALFRLAAVGAAAGAFPLLGLHFIGVMAALSAGGGLGGLWGLLWMGLYAFLVTSTTFYRLSGIQIR